MAVFKFDEVDQVVRENDNKINFLKLQDDGWYAELRFMYGPGEMFECQTVHNVSEDPRKPRYVSCLRGLNEPLDSCPLCAKGSKINAQFFIPVFVEAIISNIRGEETRQEVNQVMLFQRGSTFKGSLQTVLRYVQPTQQPIVNSLFRLVRNGKAGNQQTTYSVEYIRTDNVGLQQLPPKPEILGSYILPKLTYQEMMDKYVNGVNTAPAAANVAPAIQPRTINANTFAGNTVVTMGQTAAPSATPNNFGTTPTAGFSGNNGFVPINTNQAPVQAPNIGNAPF